MDAKTLDQLFSALTIAYGTRFRDQWAGQDAATVKRFWARELHGMASWRMAWALRHLNGNFPENAMQFKALCMQAPNSHERPAALDYQGKPMPGKVAAALAQRERPGRDPLGWAKALKAREERGEKLGSTLRRMWRAALQPSPSECGSEDESST